MDKKQKEPFSITRGNLHKYLGVPKYGPEMDKEENQIGLSTGLAWTQAGGEVLYVEVSLIGGKGDLIITFEIIYPDRLTDDQKAAIRAALES